MAFAVFNMTYPVVITFHDEVFRYCGESELLFVFILEPFDYKQKVLLY